MTKPSRTKTELSLALVHLGSPLKVTVSFGKRVSKNYNSYECVISEEWAVAPTRDSLELIETLSERLKVMVNEQLGLTIQNAPDA